MPKERASEGTGYGAVAKGLHWLVLILILVQFALGWMMPGLHPGNEGSALIGLHFGFGLLTAALVLVRLGWRVMHPVPLAAGDVSAWQESLAARTHQAMYLLLLVSPLFGWIAANVRGFAVSFFGLFTLPTPIATDRTLAGLFGGLHQWTAYGLLAIVVLHALAALYHHIVLRDDTLRRMLPRFG